MEKVKIIKNEKEYNSALKRLEELIDIDPESDTDLADELELLSLLVEKYEDEICTIGMPSPVEAIKFRMEQGNLSQKDLIPYFGTKSMVSEVLNGKRELTVKMIRALNTHLGIPAEVLLQESSVKDLDSYTDIDFDKFPVKEMAELNMFEGFDISNIITRSEEAIRYLIKKTGGQKYLESVLFRKSESTRMNVQTNSYALRGWCMAVLAKASRQQVKNNYESKKINSKFLQGLASLSILSNGPLQAKEYLANIGIRLVFMPHLKKTYLDGASFMVENENPVIGLTLRYNRVDSFWFTLFHEIAHIKNDLQNEGFIADDMSLRGSSNDSDIEGEADKFAQLKLLPKFNPEHQEQFTNEEIIEIAQEHNVHPAIVAGQIQYRKKNFKLFSNIVNKDKLNRDELFNAH